MFNIFSKSKGSSTALTDFSILKTDMHSHLLPGIDDGSPDIATSLALVKGMHNLGFHKLITTPHIMWDMYRNTRESILEKEALLNAAIREKGWDIEVRAAAEYFLDEYVQELLQRNEPLLTISGKMVLVEFSMAYPSHSLKDILFEMQMQGYQPVIAHPERYNYLNQARDFFEELKDIGCLFQLNLLSLGQYYGKTVHELAQYLSRKGYYDLVGTDLHHSRHLDALNIQSLGSPLKKLLDSGRIRNSQL
jgi:tyrosine-protein phosphatase YwqE